MKRSLTESSLSHVDVIDLSSNFDRIVLVRVLFAGGENPGSSSLDADDGEESSNVAVWLILLIVS